MTCVLMVPGFLSQVVDQTRLDVFVILSPLPTLLCERVSAYGLTHLKNTYLYYTEAISMRVLWLTCYSGNDRPFCQ